MNGLNYDVIIIGGGVSGMSAALWCDELGLKAALFEAKPELGGQLLWTYNKIENHLGIKAKNGKELQNTFINQIQNRKFDLKLNSKILDIDFTNKSISLKNKQIISAKTLVIATGVKRRTLGIDGETHFIGKGIIRSGKRDKKLVKNNKVLIIGGGDAAIENALILSETASEIYLVHRRDKFTAREEFINSVKNIKKIKFLFNTRLKEINGNEKIEYVTLEKTNSGEFYSLPIDSILFRIGVEPNVKFLKNQIKLSQSSYIIVNSIGETNLQGIYAIGDVANPISPTISSAVGTGATTIKAIYEKLKQNNLNNIQ